MGVIFPALSSRRIWGGMLCQRGTLSSHFAFLRKLHKSKASSPLPDPIIPSKTQLRAPMQMRAFRLCERRQTEADTRKTDNEGANGSGSHCWQAAGVLFGQSCRINDHRIPPGTQGAAKEKTKVSSAKMLIRPWVEGYKPFSRMWEIILYLRWEKSVQRNIYCMWLFPIGVVQAATVWTLYETKSKNKVLFWVMK